MKCYALLGRSLGHSFSRTWFEAKFRKEGIPAEYLNIEVNDLSSIRDIVERYSLYGFNVTIPFKTDIIPYLDSLNSIALEAGAVNVVRCEPNGRWLGFNTDVIGFRETLRPLLGNQSHRALILGSGGASRAVQTACNQLGIPFNIVSRNRADKVIFTYEELDPGIIREHTLIINTTPKGTYPETDTKPGLPYEGLTSGHLLYDLVYNPAETAFLKEGKARGTGTISGHAMLIRQAEESWTIWNENQSS